MPEHWADHWFWLLLTAAVVIWYSTITVYVAIKGVTDIRTMLRRLGSMKSTDSES
ncbi:MAG: hypothetical protein QUV05_17665 [Phycisphaerae bacterium]|nr:hypothetical protein [Phycisphaerae bacterium]